MEITDPQKSIFDTPKRQAFILICLATLALLFIKKSMIENETAAFEFLADQPEGSALLAKCTAVHFNPLGLLMEVYRTGICHLDGVFPLWLPGHLFAMLGHCAGWGICFPAPELIKIFWFVVVQSDPNFFDIQAFYPLSLMNLADYEQLPNRYAYPFKALNLFEPLYWLVLAIGIQHFAKGGMKPAWTIVLGFYVPVFLLWLLFYIIVLQSRSLIVF